MKHLKAVAGILISVVFLFLSLRKVNLHEALSIIYHVKWWWLILATAASLAAIVERSYRWRAIINMTGLPVRHFFEATCVGQMSNNVFPFRAGDIVQGYFLALKENLRKSLALSTVIIERLVDVCPPIFILVVSSFFIPLPEEINRGKIIAFASVIFIFMVVFVIFNKLVLNFIENILPPNALKQKIHSLISQFYVGMSFVRDFKVLSAVTFYTLFLWFLYSLVVFFTLLAFNVHIGYFGALLVCCITAVSVTIPSSPGYIGTWEFFAILALKIYSVDKGVALSFALIYHMISWVTVTALGFVVVMKSGFSITNLSQVTESKKEDADENITG